MNTWGLHVVAASWHEKQDGLSLIGEARNARNSANVIGSSGLPLPDESLELTALSALDVDIESLLGSLVGEVVVGVVDEVDDEVVGVLVVADVVGSLVVEDVAGVVVVSLDDEVAVVSVTEGLGEGEVLPGSPHAAPRTAHRQRNEDWRMGAATVISRDRFAWVESGSQDSCRWL